MFLFFFANNHFQHLCLKRPAQVMLKLSHKNLVNLIGVAVQQRPWLMVLEFLDCTSYR